MLDPFAVYAALRDDAGAITDFVFIEANRAVCEFYGLTHDELVGATLLGLHPAAGTTELLDLYRRLIETGEPLVLDSWPYPQDLLGGEIRLYDVRAVVLGDGLTSTWRDVTEQHRAQVEIGRLNAELQQRVSITTEQRDALNRELEAFAYAIAHDVRAPLRAIDGFSAAVLETERAGLSAAGAEDLHRVRLAAQRLARLLDDLMDLSHTARRDLARTRVDFGALALELAEECAADEPGRTVHLAVEPGIVVDADPGLLRLALRELLANAWKFSRPRETAHVEVGALDIDGERIFFVRDDGVGFDMRYAEHLFGAFQRLHTSDEFEGHGIGLATVQRLVMRHGGRVWADAVVDEGATFYFSLEESVARH